MIRAYGVVGLSRSLSIELTCERCPVHFRICPYFVKGNMAFLVLSDADGNHEIFIESSRRSVMGRKQQELQCKGLTGNKRNNNYHRT